ESTTEEPLPQSLQYEELLEVVTRAVSNLNIDWPAEEKAAPQKSKLDERFLRSKTFFRLAYSSPPPIITTTEETTWVVGRSMAAMVAAERHLWLTLSEMKEKDRVFLLDAPLEPSGLFGDTVDSVVSRYQEARKQAAAFQRFLPRRSLAPAAAGREQPYPCTSSSYRKVQKRSVATRAPLSRELAFFQSEARPAGPPRAAPTGEEWVAPHYTVSVSPRGPWEVSLLPLPRLQGAVAYGELTSQIFPPEDVAEPGRSPPPRGSLEQLVRQSPAGPPLQVSELAVQSTPEASLEWLVPLVDYLTAWKLLPNVSAWVLRTVEKGHSIQFGAPLLPFDEVFPTLVGPEQAPVMEQEVETLLRKEAIELVPPHERESGFYSRYFIVPKKDGGLRPIIDLRQLNRSVMRLKFMDAYCQASNVTNQVQGLVCDDRSERRVLSCLHPSSAQEVPEVCFQGQSIPVSGPSLWPSTLTPVREFSGLTSRCHSYSHESIGVKTKRQEKCPFSTSENHLSRCGVGFDHDAGMSVPCSDRVDPHRSRESQRRPVTHCKTVSTTAGSDGSCVQRDTFWPAVHETPTVVGQNQGVLPEGKPALHDQGHAAAPTCLRHVEETLVSKSGPGAGSSLSPRHASDRCIPHRLGGGHKWSSRPRSVEWSSSQLAHQLSRDAGRISSSEILSSRPERSPCVGAHQQHSGGLLYQPPGRSAFAPLIQASTPDPCVVPGQTPLTASSSRFLASEFGSRRPAKAQGMDASPRGGEADLGSVRSSSSGSLCLEVECSMSPLVLSSSSSSPGAGCHGLSHSTLKVYVAAISAYHTPLGGLSVGKDPLVTRFFRGVLRLRPPVRPHVPTWDLAVVLEALCRPPFEAIDEISVRFLTIKTALLLALTSLKRVGDLQALSVAPSHLDFAPGMTKAFLYPRAGYVPKVPNATPQLVVLQAFCPPPFRKPDQQKHNCMCPDAYVHRAALWRKSDQLFVCYGPPKKGHPVTKQTLSRWIVDAISTTYESSPLGVKAHSTRAMAASKALLLGVPIQDICNAAGWSTPFTFV
ncbi:hypothetical protein M9458_057648, partial [Cirrhinus mrigala]